MMEASVEQAKFPATLGAGLGEEGEEIDCPAEEESETELTRAMVVRQNKKRKKSGGFQSMGKYLQPPSPLPS